MDLFDNPFYILGVTPRDDTRKIVELADERSLLSDVDACKKAKSILTHPHKRIAAEVAWLPGVHPERTYEVLMLLDLSEENIYGKSRPMPGKQINTLATVLSRLPYTRSSNVASEVLELLKLSERNLIEDRFTETHKLIEVGKFLGIDKLNPIARANLIAARILRLSMYTRDNVIKWINEIVRAFEVIDPIEVCTTLNEERKAAGCPQITNLSMIEEQIQNRRYHYGEVIWRAIAKLSSAGKEVVGIITVVVESATSNEEKYCPILIEDLVDAYEEWIQKQEVLEKIEKEIETLNMEFRFQIDRELTKDRFGIESLRDSISVLKLNLLIKKWHNIAHPIQVIKKIRGQHHEASHRLGENMRQLAIHLFNEYNKLDLSQEILSMLQEVFAEVPAIVERIVTDLETLNEIAERREQEND